MSKAKVEHIFKGLGEIRRKKSKIKGRKALDLLSLKATPTFFNQIKHLKVDQRPLNHWGKDQGNQLNVGDVEETICLKIAHNKEVEQSQLKRFKKV